MKRFSMSRYVRIIATFEKFDFSPNPVHWFRCPLLCLLIYQTAARQHGTCQILHKPTSFQWLLLTYNLIDELTGRGR